ncbi:hypothetical protein BJ322DRAFT_15862 [Thelephora terrestris]|uniref:Uncharacterized protein n=1 Tax=Thelephora terrestris TaxID=56493 RepID=A0A9P6HQP1_9AGAM|nr:hypothetical protein BJ322DRAFT_15862 [Thelephora terrestris]
MIHQNTANKRKGPPKFQHLPKARAKQLKSAWIQTRKIKSKWRAEKRREGIESVGTPSTAPELEIPVPNVPGPKPDHQPQFIDAHTGSDALPSTSKGHPVKVPNTRTVREPIRTTRTGPAVGSSQEKDRRSGRPSGYQGKKPSMKNRMITLLEKIQRESD